MARKKVTNAMGIDRSKLTGVVRELKVHYFGDTVTVRYQPSKITSESEKEQAALRPENLQDDTAAANDFFVNKLSEILDGWDVIEDGKEVPTTAKELGTFPVALLAHIYDAINLDMYPNLKAARR